MSHPNHPPTGHPVPGNPAAGYAYPPPPPPAGYAYPPPGYGAPPPGPHGALPPGYPPAPYGYAYPPPGYAHPPSVAPAPTGYAAPPHMPPGYGYPPTAGYPNHPGVPPPHGYAYPPHAYPPAPVPVVPHPAAAPVAHVPIATNPPAAPVAPTPPKPTLATWNVSSEDSAKINYWFTDLDKDSRGSIGGVEAVQFLKKSNLPKETLREIWNIVDSEKQGRLDRSRFLAAIRFLCILCNPMYAGSKPSIELFNNTIHANLPIPVQLEATNEADVNPFAALETVQAPVTISHSDAISASFPETVVSAPLPELPPLTKPVHHNSQFPVANNNISIGNVEDEEFSDFAAAQSVPAMPSTTLNPASTIPLPSVSTSSTTIAVEEEDDFSDFQSTTPVLTPPSQSQSQQVQEEEDVFAGLSADITPAPLPTLTPSIVAPQNPPAITVQDDEEDDDFEGFQEAVTPIANHDPSKIVEELVLPSSQITSAESNNSLSSMSTAQGVISSTTLPLGHTPISSMMQSNRNESNNRLSVFDDLVESDLKVQAEEWDDFADAPQPSTSLEPQQKQQDDMIDLLAIDEEPITVQISLPVSAPQDEDFEFGDFEASPQPSQPATSIASANNSDNLDNKKESAWSSNADPVEDDFGDFENFQAPEPAVATNIALEQLPVEDDDFGDFGAFEESKPAEEVPEDNLLDFSIVQDSPILVSNTSSQPATTQVIDLLDLLSDQPSFISPPPPSNQINHNSFDPFAPAPVSASGFDANFAAFPEDNDFEADFQTAFDNNVSKPVEEKPKQVQEPSSTLPQKLTIKKAGKSPVDKPTGKVAVTSSSSSSGAPKSSKPVRIPPHTKPLSVKELQHLSEMLFEKQSYDESYDAALQAYVLQNIQRLMEEQQRALENDDLEATMKIKQEADTFVSQMDSLEAEQRWILKSKLTHKGQSLHDMFEAIGLFDPSYAAVFKDKYMKQLPKPHVSVNTLVPRVRHYALAKRSARMIVAIISSHQQHPAMWKQMLQHIEKMLMEGNNVLLSFSSLSSSDQKSIKQQESFVQYTKSLVQVAEVGMYLATSCFEIYKHESDAKKVITLAKEVLQLSKKEWNISSTMLKMTWQDLSLLACKYSEQKNVVYCNITLRPLFQNKEKVLDDDEESDDSNSKKKKIEIYPHVTNLESSAFSSEVKNGNPTFYYMKPALNLWIHDLSKNMPDADGEFI